MGLNAILGTAGQALELFSSGIEVAGQNIANANTPGYVREQLLIESAPFYKTHGLLLGTGARGAGVKQQIDQFLESQLHAANSNLETTRSRDTAYKQLEFELHELGDLDLSTAMNDFLATLNDVVNQPESVPLRQFAVQQGTELANDIRTVSGRVNDLRAAQSTRVGSLVQEANDLIDRIQNLNPRITSLEASSMKRSDAGALRTERYKALNRLSEIVSIRAVERAGGNVDVFAGSSYLILGGSVQHLETFGDVDRGVGVVNARLEKTKSVVSNSGGELRGVVEGRDLVLGGFQDQLNTYTSNLIFEFNRIHTSGKGLRGLSNVTSTGQVTDSAATLNNAGLDFTPTHGSFNLKSTNQSTGITDTTNITIDLDGIGGNDTTLQDLRDQINLAGNGNITASITTDRRLKLDAAAGFEFSFANDTSRVLASLGINTFFTGSNARDIGVNAAVANDHELFATSLGGGPSDGRNAVRLAQFNDNPVEAMSGASLDTFYNALLTNVAEASASESAIAEGFDGYRESLLNQREQFSGVSLDEQAIQILQFQQAFQAAARVVKTVDELFTVLLTI